MELFIFDFTKGDLLAFPTKQGVDLGGWVDWIASHPPLWGTLGARGFSCTVSGCSLCRCVGLPPTRLGLRPISPDISEEKPLVPRVSLGSLKPEIIQGNKTITEAILSRIVPISLYQVSPPPPSKILDPPLQAYQNVNPDSIRILLQNIYPAII